MPATCAVAYKEWAAVEAALAQGRYVLTLRKGGIHEKKGEFTVEHRAFWLFPTLLHQRESDLIPDVLPLLEESKKHPPPEGRVPIRCFATVSDAVYIESLEAAHALEGLHPFTRAAVEMRFHYKKPGLWAIVQRLHALPQPVVIEDHRTYAGCRSWVPLVEALPTDGAKPVLDDATFKQKQAELAKLLPAG